MSWLMLVVAILAQAPAEGQRRARETAYARIPIAQKLAADAELLKALAARNQAAESQDALKRRDEEWRRNKQLPLRKELTHNACADRLRGLVRGDPFIVEALLMDRRGGLVCSTVETEDYWQGDEAKWIKTYGEGGQVFVDEPALDANTDTWGVQLSVLVSQGTEKAGALTLTLKVPRELPR